MRAIGRVAEARLLILDGDVQQGLALLDQAGVATVSGDLDPLSTGIVYCELVCALQGLAQYDVAEEWTEAMERWCETNAIGSLHGRCRVHRAEILRLRGSCDEAESQALMACEELRPYLRRELGWPLNELGRIRLHRGDIAGAEEALLAAHRAGWDPQPGLALVRLAQGDVSTAAASIRAALERPLRVPSKERPPNTDLQRAPLLDAQVQIEIAAGDIGRARSAADELELVASRFENKALIASAALARGRVLLADGDAAGAEQSVSEAVRLWNEVGAPYEAALARITLAEAHAASGSEHRAVLERQAARTILDGIEAAPPPVAAPIDLEQHDPQRYVAACSFRPARLSPARPAVAVIRPVRRPHDAGRRYFSEGLTRHSKRRDAGNRPETQTLSMSHLPELSCQRHRHDGTAGAETRGDSVVPGLNISRDATRPASGVTLEQGATRGLYPDSKRNTEAIIQEIPDTICPRASQILSQAPPGWNADSSPEQLAKNRLKDPGPQHPLSTAEGLWSHSGVRAQ